MKMKPIALILLIQLGMVFNPLAASKLLAQTVDRGTSYSENPWSSVSSGGVDHELLNWQPGSFNEGFMPDQSNLIDGDMDYAPGAIVARGGEISSAVPDSNDAPADSLNGMFEAKSATWPIPEPSSALLIMVVGFKCMLRRRRSGTRLLAVRGNI